jgi:hypothetical protein
MVPRWAAVDELIHELGAVRSTLQLNEAEPELADADVTIELRVSVDRASDVLHQVIGGDDTVLARARRTLLEAREVAARATAALDQCRAIRAESQRARDAASAHAGESAQHREDFGAIRKSWKDWRPAKKDPRSSR